MLTINLLNLGKNLSIHVHRVIVSNPVFSISSPGFQKSGPGFLKDESGFFSSPGPGFSRVRIFFETEFESGPPDDFREFKFDFRYEYRY